MSSEQLPIGWMRTSLGSVTNEEGGRVGIAPPPIVLSSTKHHGLVPSDEFFKGRTIYSADLSNYKVVQRDWFAYATNHLAEGSIGLQRQFEVACVSPIYTVFSCRDSVDPGFLFRVLKAPTSIAAFKFFEQASVDRRGAVRYGDFARVSIDLPSMREQDRIAEVLDATDDAIRASERVIAKLELIKHGLFRDLLTRGITEHGALRDPLQHPEQFSDTALGLLPSDWRVASCRDLCREIVVGIVIRPTQWYADSGVPVLRSANVREDGIDLADLTFMSPASHRALAKSAVSPGDVVTVRTGNPGATAVIPDSLREANCVDIIISRSGPSLLPQYLSTWVNAPIGKEQVLAKQGGLAQQHFNVREMKNLLVAVPSLSEQREICKRTTAIQQQIRAEQDLLAKSYALKSGLIEDLLAGRVRVPVGDEDAA